MKQRLLLSMALGLAILLAACVSRIAPFSPRRTNSEAHQKAVTKQACIVCHNTMEIGGGHSAKDDCLKCHRIVHGD